MTEAPILEIRFKVLGNPTATTYSVPADLTTDSLVTLVADFAGFPPDDISLVYKGRAFKPGDTLASRNVENLSTITVSRKHRPRPPSSDPPPPPPAASRPPSSSAVQFEQSVQHLFATLQAASAPPSELRISLSNSDSAAANTQLANVVRSIDALSTELSAFTRPPLSIVRSVDGTLQGDPPVISAEDRAEMERVAATLESYAAENELADTFRASNLFVAMGFS
jgi:hypothetical protein